MEREMDDPHKLYDEFHGSNISEMMTGKLKATSHEVIDQSLAELKANQQRWAQDYPIAKRIELLKETLGNILTYEGEWVNDDLIARHIPHEHWDVVYSIFTGPCMAAAITKLFIEILGKLKKHGGTKPFATMKQSGDRVIVHSYPRNIKERLLMFGLRGEIRLQKGTKVNDLDSLQAIAYKDPSYQGGVSLILGAGNASSLTINDLYQKLFVEKKVAIVKCNPLMEYMGPLLEKVLEPFIREGFVRVVNGGEEEGKYIANHPLVDDIHITGSDKTFESIVYGTGEEGLKNKAADRRINPRPVTGELSNVTPVIIVPGNWRKYDFDYQADNILYMLAAGIGYTCTSMRVLILPKYWNGSQKLIEKLKEKMSTAEQACNYYPGTKGTIEEALAIYPNSWRSGHLDNSNQPWIMAENLDPNAEEVAFYHEFWGAFFCQTFIDGANKEEYLANAVKFANEKLWGTLSCAIIIDSKSQKLMRKNKSLLKAIDELKYGTVALNTTPALFAFMATSPWGGYPGAQYNDIQSGNGFVTNPFMLEKIEKSVISAPFIMHPRPFWFIGKLSNVEASEAFAEFFISGKYIYSPKLVWALTKYYFSRIILKLFKRFRKR